MDRLATLQASSCRSRGAHCAHTAPLCTPARPAPPTQHPLPVPPPIPYLPSPAPTPAPTPAPPSPPPPTPGGRGQEGTAGAGGGCQRGGAGRHEARHPGEDGRWRRALEMRTHVVGAMESWVSWGACAAASAPTLWLLSCRGGLPRPYFTCKNNGQAPGCAVGTGVPSWPARWLMCGVSFFGHSIAHWSHAQVRFPRARLTHDTGHSPHAARGWCARGGFTPPRPSPTAHITFNKVN